MMVGDRQRYCDLPVGLPSCAAILMIHPDRVVSGSIVIAVTVAEPVTGSRGEGSTEDRELPTDEGVPPPLVYPLSPPSLRPR